MTLEKWLQQHELKASDYDLVRRAFTHASYVNESKTALKDNERLEFIGDAVLQLWSAAFLYRQTPELNEGQMTLLRAQLVNESALASFGKQLDFSEVLLLGAGEKKNGGMERDSIIADAFEAFIGALYLDGSMENVNLILEKTITVAYDTLDKVDLMDYKTTLQEFMQSDTRKTVTYELVSSKGPSNNPTFDSLVTMDGIILGRGSGPTKKKSQQAAAKDALEKLVK